MKVHYEEKTYENYFNTELGRRSKFYFPIGQVQEGSVGFDSAAYSTSRTLWWRFGFRFWFRPPVDGVPFENLASIMESELAEEVKALSNLKVNVLFQFKRPVYITTNSGNEWSTWQTPYYRYEIESHQQSLLMDVLNKLGDKILILYAAPALPGIAELVQAHLNGNVIERSNFRLASELSSHHVNTYTESGTYSVAFSEPEVLNNFDLIEMLEADRKPISKESSENASEIRQFSRIMKDVMLENKHYRKPFQELLGTQERLAEYPLFESFSIMSMIRDLSGLQWFLKL